MDANNAPAFFGPVRLNSDAIVMTQHNRRVRRRHVQLAGMIESSWTGELRTLDWRERA